MPRTAHQAFLESPAKVVFAQLADNKSFDTACEYALLAYVEALPAGTNPNDNWTLHAQLVGAREVLAILRTLHLPIEPVKVERLPRLNPPK